MTDPMPIPVPTPDPQILHRGEVEKMRGGNDPYGDPNGGQDDSGWPNR